MTVLEWVLGFCDDEEIEREVDLECIIDSMDNTHVEINHQCINHVKDLSATTMRERLIIHFDIPFRTTSALSKKIT